MPYTNGKDKLDDSVQYQRLVVKLIYLTITRPDIAYSIQAPSQFMDAPKESHMNSVLKVDMLKEVLVWAY